MKQINPNDICSVFAFSPHKLKLFSKPIIAYAYYKNHRVNLSSGSREEYSLASFIERVDAIKVDSSYSCPYVFHFFYELGYHFVGLDHFIGDEDILAIEILYGQVDDYRQYSDPNLAFNGTYSPSFPDYQEKFERGYEHLLEGNCYQFNLTCPFLFEGNEFSFDHLLAFFWKKRAAAYAHATQVPLLKRTFVSNSPECLFQMRRESDSFRLWTMPIKGTVPFEVGDSFKDKWKELKSCSKNRAELDMITDLLRNDLSSIEQPSAQIVKRSMPLIVPRILHQYSLIEVLLSHDIGLGKIMAALFPGGSITGAPKRRVMEILKQLEERSRGFYCGSTVLFYGDAKAASINIRSAEFDTSNNSISYQAGGGITLQSQASSEFEEMELKVRSLFSE